MEAVLPLAECEKILRGISQEKASAVFGSFDCYSELIENEFGVVLSMCDEGIKVSGVSEDSVSRAYKAVEYLAEMAGADNAVSLTEQSVRYVIDMVKGGGEEELAELAGATGECVCITTKGKPIKAKTVGQKKYVYAIKKNTVIFGIGPAGTGKTFLAVAMAVNALRAKQVNRIILTRPAVEAGERLGFLPGDLQSKIDPYLRPLYDALFEMVGSEGYARYSEKGAIEIAPLAYMRGRTLDDSFIILDEAQNTTPEQMKMFLTRLGFGSKAVITGDVTQVDLPSGVRSGLVEASRVLENIDGIAIHRLGEKDIVRHALVQKIIVAYEKYEKEKKVGRENEKYNIYKKRPKEN